MSREPSQTELEEALEDSRIFWGRWKASPSYVLESEVVPEGAFTLLLIRATRRLEKITWALVALTLVLAILTVVLIVLDVKG